MTLSDPLKLQIWYADRHCQVLTTHKMCPRKGRSFGHVTVFSISVQWLSLLSHTPSGEEGGHQKHHEMLAGEIGEKCTPPPLDIIRVWTICTR